MAIHIHIHDAAPKKTRDEAKPAYGVRNTAPNTWRVMQAGKPFAVAGPFKTAEEAQAWIKNQKSNSMKDAVSEVEKGKMVAMLSHKMNISSKVAREALVAEEWDYEEAVKDIRASNTKDSTLWSAKHMGNFRFEVTAPDGRKISVPRAGTSAEAIEKAKALKTKDSTFTGTESAWQKKVKDAFPAATFRPRPTGKVVAKVGDKDVGEYNKEKGTGTIEDGVRDSAWSRYKELKLKLEASNHPKKTQLLAKLEQLKDPIMFRPAAVVEKEMKPKLDAIEKSISE